MAYARFIFERGNLNYKRLTIIFTALVIINLEQLWLHITPYNAAYIKCLHHVEIVLVNIENI
jgi:hypothetical protein